MNELPSPQRVEEATIADLRSMVRCSAQGDVLLLDTPYVLQDGHSLQVWISASDEGLCVSDGGWALSQAELFARTASLRSQRATQIGKLARRLNLDWDGEIGFIAPTLEAAVTRLPDLARAVDLAIGLNQAAPIRQRVIVETLRKRIDALGIECAVQAPLEVGDGRLLRVDLLASRENRSVVIETLAGRTPQGAKTSLDRVVTNLHVLAKAGYGRTGSGSLLAVYDGKSFASTPDNLQRLEDAKPTIVRVVSVDDAPDAVLQALRAA